MEKLGSQYNTGKLGESAQMGIFLRRMGGGEGCGMAGGSSEDVTPTREIKACGLYGRIGAWGSAQASESSRPISLRMALRMGLCSALGWVHCRSARAL
jgi:hypothetical protein